MRVFGSVQLCFWANPNTQKLSDQAKLLAIYLLTGPHSNMLGCLRLPDGYIAEDLRWELSTIKQAFIELAQIDFLTRDHELNWVVIHQFLQWNPIQNPKQGVGIRKLFELVPCSSLVWRPLVKSLITYGKYFDEGFVNRLHSFLRKCFSDKEQDQDKDKEQDTIIMSSKLDMVNEDPLFTIEKMDDQFEQSRGSSLQEQAKEILNFLNEKTKCRYRFEETNLKLIISRLKSGASVDDCRAVIARKFRDWNGTEMQKYLRPATLFNPIKFEQYLGECVVEDTSDNGLTQEGLMDEFK